ncbi:transketolase [Candidatus Uhrbacteria bacterium]|nr:transketolase [Candidatus Uhrbacteria bacterium]
MHDLDKLAKLLRYYILRSTTEAGSGHPSSSLSAVELMAALFFGGFFRFKKDDTAYHNNDRLIFSKGHASPLFYSLWAAAGAIPEDELLSLRKLGSRLEGHPTMDFPYTETPTGSLGQGLSVGVGMAINAKYLDKLPYRTTILLGDSEMAEGSVWEALALASHYSLGNLVGILDVNRLGQRGPTMLEHNCDTYEKRIAAFCWKTYVIDGHSIEEICNVYTQVYTLQSNRPTMIIAKTLKGNGISFMENKDGWHGKALKQEEYEQALAELGEIDYDIRGTLTEPAMQESRIKNQELSKKQATSQLDPVLYPPDKAVATRRAYGNALVRLAQEYPAMVVLDAEVSNSTYAEFFKNAYPDRFFEMFIAEQNMVGAALGLSRRGKKPCISTFAAFFSRAHDQIRMCQYANSDIVFCGSHAGVSIGEDGASQMGLEDIGLFRSLLDSVVLYPSDAISCERLVERALGTHGLVYIRTTRKDTPLLYTTDDQFRIGGSMTLREDPTDRATIVAAGITLHEALAAHETLKHEGISTRVIDLYSIKPLDMETLEKAARETKAIITVEDHLPEGGIGEAVAAALSHTKTPVHSLAVRTMPHSGTPDELLAAEHINGAAIVKKIRGLL